MPYQTFICPNCKLRNNYVGEVSAPPKCRRCKQKPSSNALESISERIERTRMFDESIADMRAEAQIDEIASIPGSSGT